MKRSDIDDDHVIELALRWYGEPFKRPGVVAALVAEGVPRKLALAKVERLVERGLLDYGVSPNFAWPRVGADEWFADWHRLNRRYRAALRDGLCTCCAFITRAGDTEPRQLPAVCEWVTLTGSRELLCASCLGHWQKNAEEDETLAPASLVMLADTEIGRSA